MSIPVHHDTGYWVKHTHRIHVPIITGERVDFLVGPTEERMRKVLFEEGSIVELNNQAKHAVTNNEAFWRVHLIFDYVEDHPVTRFAVGPGEKIYQTRRSLDLEREAGTRKAPSFIILGAQKSGTTSLHSYICQHPLVLAGKRRETHYFDWRWASDASVTTAEQHYQYYLNFYHSDVLRTRPSLLTGESTPSYLLHSDVVIPRIKLVVPWVRMLVILRDPVDRAFSQYQMCVSTEGTDEQKRVRGMSSYVSKSFTQVVREEIQAVTDAGLTPTSSMREYREAIKDLPMGHGGHSLILRGCYCLQLEPWLEAFPGDQIKIMSIADIKGSAQKVNQSMAGVYSFIDLPPHDIEDVEPKNTRAYDPLDQDVRVLLQQFYEPYNQRLFELLGVTYKEW
jgi:hypothetical protein